MPQGCRDRADEKGHAAKGEVYRLGIYLYIYIYIYIYIYMLVSHVQQILLTRGAYSCVPACAHTRCQSLRECADAQMRVECYYYYHYFHYCNIIFIVIIIIIIIIVSLAVITL